MKKLNKSKVVFDAERHEYWLDGVQLRGITSVIKERVFPGMYAGIPEETLRRAADRGKRVHSALELYDTCGLMTAECPELDNYIARHADTPWLAQHAASEYLVTDGKQYASAIDKVYADPDDDTAAVLADVKTTSKLDTEYVSWQLSVYAEWFEALNPGTRVSHLYAIWLRGTEARYVEVARKMADQVRALLYGTGDLVPVDPVEALPAIAAMESEIIRLKTEADAAAAKMEEIKRGMLDIMQKANARVYESDFLRVTRKAASIRTRLDAARLKKECPDVYDQFCTTSTTGETILLSIKNQTK